MDDRRVVVIGSGPTGAMAAHELVHRGIPVTMLESGDKYPHGLLVRVNGRNVFRIKPDDELKSGNLHSASSDPQTEFYYNLSPGGVSNQWTGAVPRFAPEDFFEGQRLDERYRWPVSYEELEPYYGKAEKLMDVTASKEAVPQLPAATHAAYTARLPKDWQAVAKHAAARGQGLTALPLADGPPWMIARRGTAFNSYTNIIRRLLNSPHFELITGAHVLRLVWSGSQNRVESVIYHDRQTGSEKRLPAAAAIVACGPLNSTKLLFNSACPDFPDGLGNTDGVLGRYLHDHPREWWSFSTGKPLSPLAPSAYLTRRPYEESDPLLANSWTLGVVSTKDKLLSFTPFKVNTIGVQLFGTMIPTEEHWVRPDESRKDEFGQPILNVHIRYEDDVINNMVAARTHLLAIMEDAGYSSTLHEVVPQLHPGSSVHYGGSVRMHELPQYGMLDAWNRLHAVPNVLVVDASSFTTGAEKNPTLTAMALAARAAHRLAEDIKR